MKSEPTHPRKNTEMSIMANVSKMSIWLKMSCARVGRRLVSNVAAAHAAVTTAGRKRM